MKLLIVRHAESNGNADGDYSVASHDSLSSRGRRQALTLARCLMKYKFDRILVSPLQRALETIAPFLESTTRHAEIWPEIAEACWQSHRERASERWKTQPAFLPPHMAHLLYFRDNDAVKPAEDETFSEGLCRVYETRWLLQEMAGGSCRSVLMVTHGHFIQELINALLGAEEIISYPHDNCGITSLTFDKAWRLISCNCNCAFGVSL